MKISVVVCTYASERYDHFVEAVESILAQTYDPIEIVLVVDGNQQVFDRVVAEFANRECVVTHCNDTNRGVSASRTTGAELATGDVVAFIDDDAVADPTWVAELVAVYESRDTIAVGGRMAGQWLGGRPWFLPEEFYWLIGVTYPGFAEDGEEIRNTFESNISFRRTVFLEIGGFDPKLGPTAETYRHSEGAEIGTRLVAQYDRGVIYTPDAVVSHKVFPHRLRLRWLSRRAFQQGQSKRAMEEIDDVSTSEEVGYLRTLFVKRVPRRFQELLRSPSVDGVAQLLMIFTSPLASVWGMSLRSSESCFRSSSPT